jgi:hypothetical protein
LCQKIGRYARHNLIESGNEEKTNIDTHVIRYITKITYVFNDSLYENDNFNFCMEWLTKNELSQLLTDYPVGTIIELRVNTKKPKVSVIKAGAGFCHYSSVVVCGGFFIAFIYLLRTW